MCSDHKKQNSPLPAAVAGYLLAGLVAVFGSDPHSHTDADLFWLTATGLPCTNKG